MLDKRVKETHKLARRPIALILVECVDIEVEKHPKLVVDVEVLDLHADQVIAIAMLRMNPLRLHRHAVEVAKGSRNVVE